jgi:hypothetical protein
MLAWSREVRAASPSPGPRGSGVVVWRFLRGRHDSDTGPLGRGCHWSGLPRPSPWSSVEVRDAAEGLGGELQPVQTPTRSVAHRGRQGPEDDDEVDSAPAGYVSGREWVGWIIGPIPPMTQISNSLAGRLTWARRTIRSSSDVG